MKLLELAAAAALCGLVGCAGESTTVEGDEPLDSGSGPADASTAIASDAAASDAAAHDAAQADAATQDASDAAAEVGDTGVDGGDGEAGPDLAVAPRFRSIEAGQDVTCAIDEAGDAFCWGEYRGTFADRVQRVRAPDDGHSWQTFVAEEGPRCGVRGEQVFCAGDHLSIEGWPDHESPPAPVPDIGASQDVAVSRSTVCVLGVDGRVRCWGINDVGLLGRGIAPTRPECSTQCPYEPAEVSGDHIFRALDVYPQAACGIAEGRVWCWGLTVWNGLDAFETCMQSTERETKCQTSPTLRAELSDHDDWVEVRVGRQHVCALRANGELHCGGRNNTAQRGDANPVGRYRQFDTGGQHTCGVTDDGRLECWGTDADGQLGDGPGEQLEDIACSSALNCSERPVEVAHPRGKSWAQVTAGRSHTCALDADGIAYCWGDNGRAQLAQPWPSVKGSDVPVAVTAME